MKLGKNNVFTRGKSALVPKADDFNKHEHSNNHKHANNMLRTLVINVRWLDNGKSKRFGDSSNNSNNEECILFGKGRYGKI